MGRGRGEGGRRGGGREGGGGRGEGGREGSLLLPEITLCSAIEQRVMTSLGLLQ